MVEAKKFLEAEGLSVFQHWIRQYKAYQYAFLEGIPVYRVKNPKAQDAWGDYQAVMQEVMQEEFYAH